MQLLPNAEGIRINSGQCTIYCMKKQDNWSKGNTDTELVKLAQQLNLDMPRFEHCFNSKKGLERVLSDIYDAQGLIKKTPTFIFIDNGKASRVQGTKSPEKFTEIIEKRLAKKERGSN